MVEKLGLIAPNRLGSIVFKIAGRTTNCSPTFEVVGVNDIDRRCLLIFVTGFSLGDICVIPDGGNLLVLIRTI